MTDKELKRLNRSELLQILLDQSIEIDHLQRKLSETKAALQERELKIAQAGTLAEAAMRLNQIFADADAAAALYLENIRRMEAEWAQKTGGESVAPAPEEAPPNEGGPQTDTQSLDAAIESAIPEPKQKKTPGQKRNKSRHKK